MSSPQRFTILTEEVPSQDEITFMVTNVLNLPADIHIHPLCVNNNFKGEWLINLEKEKVEVSVKLFKGKTSSPDYLLFEGDVNNETNPETAICILESTKTNDSSSRNTSVNQRISKFVVFQQMYPKNQSRKIMFYNRTWKKASDALTATGKFGMMLMRSLNIEAFHGENNVFENLYELYKIDKFESIDSMIAAKNEIKEKKGNVSVKIEVNDGNYQISCRLDKGKPGGNSYGKMSHDPNVGLLCGLVNFIHMYSADNNCKIIVENHNISQEYFNKLRENKFWYAIHGIDVSFAGVADVKRPELPSSYFTIESECTEKIATILFSQVIDKQYSCIFSNHSGCALTNIKTKGADIVVERTMKRPDILFYNESENTLLIVEGKIEKDIKKGVAQLQDSNLDRFMQLIQTAYPGSTIKKGLCITINKLEKLEKYKNLEFPVVFAIDSTGSFYCDIH